ncbi:uncharacterized protein LOC124326129 [Daphnia pulicaria]|uniref:uncharacterized protein LOC124326129 n=1 Tax=Daphnia pulicaria TaxID=35523 RepID=UPI001EEA89CA|nr:uncharacterized protein LOC124326129 [Daphnia pulicaria]
MPEIPVVDLSNMDLHKDRITNELDKAFSTVGFVYLKNHGIDQEKVDNLFKASRNFFQLPENVKKGYPRDRENFDGYTGRDQEILEDSSSHEVREAYDVTSPASRYPDDSTPEFRLATCELAKSLRQLTTNLLKFMAVALGLDEDYLNSRHRYVFDGVDKNGTMLRSLYYPSLTGDDIQPGVVRCGEHTDYGTITLLLQDDMGGLEVLSGKEWVAAVPIAETVLVNLGDLMQFWTSDRYVATVKKQLDTSLLLRLFLSLLSGNDGNPNGHFETFFKNFDNETGADSFIVPNIIHFIRFDKFPLGFVDYVVLKAAMRNHKPDKFFFHTDVKNATCDGKYWDLVKKDRDLWSRIEVKYLEAPTEIFGQQLSEDFRLYHGSDIARIRVLMQYGGIYLDNDCFVIHSLDKYRKFECVVNWDEDQFLGNQVFIAHKNSRFLALYLESYKDNYYPDRWYYNGGERPTTEILFHHPHLIHRVKGDFGADTEVGSNLFTDPNYDWRRFDIIHMLMGHRYYMDPHFNETEEFDEGNIRTYRYTFGTMAREVLDLEPDFSLSP